MQVITNHALTIAYGTGSHTFHFSTLPQEVPPIFETSHSAATQFQHALEVGALTIWAPQDAPAVSEAVVAPASDQQSDLSDLSDAAQPVYAAPKGKGRR